MESKFCLRCFSCGAETVISPPTEGRPHKGISELYDRPSDYLYYEGMKYSNDNIRVILYDYDDAVGLRCNKCGNIVADTKG